MNRFNSFRSFTFPCLGYVGALPIAMSIEFYCVNCYQRVECPDSSGGKKGKCPHCGVIQDIPAGSPTPSTPQQVPRGAGSSSDLLADIRAAAQTHTSGSAPPAGWKQTEEAMKWGDSKRENKSAVAMRNRDSIRRQITLPTVGLMICGIVSFVASGVASLFLGLFVAGVFFTSEDVEPNPGFVLLCIAGIVYNFFVSTLMIMGANHARFVKNYSVAIAGAVLAIFPNLCWFSLIFGIWMIKDLLLPEVRQAFVKT